MNRRRARPAEPTLRRIPAAVLAVLLLAAARCGSPRTAPKAAGEAPRFAHRAVLVSVDGMSGDRLARLLAEKGQLPSGGLARIAESGFFAVRSRPVTPSLTPSSHATHVTGATPRDTGIVGNSLLDPARPFGSKRTGFETPLRAETLCEAAHRQGKRVGVMSYPHAAGTPQTDCAGFGMNWVSSPMAPPHLVKLAAASWSSAADAPQGSGSAVSFSPPRRVDLSFPPTAHRVTLVAIDTTDDGRIDYDRLRIEAERGPAGTVAVGGWFPVEVPGRAGRAGAWCKLLSLAPDLSSAEIYLGGLWESDVYPEAFRRVVDARAGFWPGRADFNVFGPQSTRAEVYLEQSDRLTEFLTNAGLAALERSDWDLLFLYQSEVDAVEHSFLLIDPRQENYSRERAARFAGFIDHAYAVADDAVARYERALTPRDAIFVTSDHGMTPLWTEVYPDEILREAGFLRTGPDGSVDPSSAAVAMAAGGLAHVYVNKSAPAGTLDAVEKLLRGFSVGGESPWDRVMRRADARELDLDAPESGDLILLARPGIAVSMRMKSGVTSGPAEEYGGHGYRAAYRDLDATLLASGPGVVPGRIEEISSTRIAARFAAALGIAPPRQAQP